jgi:hypothetical protein
MTDETAPVGVRSIDDVLRRMAEIEATVPASDGVACFNLLYRNVTREIRAHPLSAGFEEIPFLDQLDVTFANQFFDAYDRVDRGDPCPSAWAPLFDHRHRPGVTRIQFALAGMNAHINHDLPLAVINTATEQRVEPFGDSPFERDFFRVNDVLKNVQGKVKSWFETDVEARVDRALGDVDDALSMWCIHAARRGAWDIAAILWRLRDHPQLREGYERSLSQIVNLAGRAVLI